MKTIIKMGLAAVLALSMTFSAFALSITPVTGELNVTRWQGPILDEEGNEVDNQNNQNDIIAYIAGIMGEGTVNKELWKSDYDPSALSGDLASSYSVTYSGDPNNALIEYKSGDIVGPVAFLLVKDGNHSPFWYLYDLTALTWNGTEELNLTGFWSSGSGAISNIGLFGNRASVPDGGLTILLLGAAMAGLGFANRKLRKA